MVAWVKERDKVCMVVREERCMDGGRVEEVISDEGRYERGVEGMVLEGEKRKTEWMEEREKLWWIY